MDVASTPLLASSFPYGFFGRFMRRGKGRSFFQMVEHFAHVRERVVLCVAHHRVVLALRNLAHVVALFDLRFSFCHFNTCVYLPPGLPSGIKKALLREHMLAQSSTFGAATR